jgi:outer membrane protein insertion porin family
LEPGVPFNRSFLASDIYTIKKQYFERGYLAVVVEDSVKTTGRRVEIYYDIDPGPTFNIDEIEIAGNAMTKDFVIEKELTFSTGDLFRLSKILETQRNLFETGLFNEANIDPQNLDPVRRTVDIRVVVAERKSKYVEVGFGVGNVLGSRVIGEWGDRNLFGSGRTLTLRAEYAFAITQQATSAFDDFIKFYRYDAVFAQRRVFRTKVLLGINGFIEKDATVPDIEVRTQGVFFGGRRRFGLRNELILGLSTERVKRRTSVIILADPTVQETQSTSNIFTTNLNRNTRDFVLDPKQGAYHEITTQVAGGVLGGDNDFYTLTGTMQRYWPVKFGMTFALRVRLGAGDAFGGSKDTGVPVENRYFTGGGNSVRGYNENSLGPTRLSLNADGDLQQTVVGGEALLLTNAEMRFPLPLLARYRFSGAFFLDGGNSWESWESVQAKDFKVLVNPGDVRQEDFRYTIGLGIRYNTPVGPIRLDYGYPIKRMSGESGRFHFSLGQIF